MADPKAYELIHPLLDASVGVTGLPTIIFFGGMPRLIIYLTAVPEKNPPEFMNKPS